MNIHSPQWMWTSLAAFEAAGVEPATNWDELKAAAPALREAGILPLAQGMQGWQTGLLLYSMISGIGGAEFYKQIFEARDEEALNSDTLRGIFEEYAVARELAAGGNLSDWNMATNRIIEGTAAAQVMGDWAQGEFALAGQTAGRIMAAISDLAASLHRDRWRRDLLPHQSRRGRDRGADGAWRGDRRPEAQVAFNAAKGSLPMRGDIDLANVNECAQAGLETLQAAGTRSRPSTW